ncbi:MAG: acyl-ACP--UDP-N-acetylglucosamine O-acyltransferase [Phycisphaerales bacterium]|nr:acyl-ACP--UDP-N-acetylglucosamine O-acyltransferase [Phycisphaerales bacterium]
MDPLAQLSEDVVVGPGCVIDGPVKIGPGTTLLAQVHLRGNIVIGARNQVYPFAVLGGEPQDRKFKPGDMNPQLPGLVIGDDNIFRESVTIHRATGSEPTRIGNNNMFMAGSHVAHDCSIGNHVTMVNSSLIGGHVHVQDMVTLGGNSSVHQHCRIGRLAFLSGSEALVKDLPPFCMVIGRRSVSCLNLVGIRRAGYRNHIKNLEKAFDILFRQRHTNFFCGGAPDAGNGARPFVHGIGGICQQRQTRYRRLDGQGHFIP